VIRRAIVGSTRSLSSHSKVSSSSSGRGHDPLVEHPHHLERLLTRIAWMPLRRR
jgi:hypothetical protein